MAHIQICYQLLGLILECLAGGFNLLQLSTTKNEMVNLLTEWPFFALTSAETASYFCLSSPSSSLCSSLVCLRVRLTSSRCWILSSFSSSNSADAVPLLPLVLRYTHNNRGPGEMPSPIKLGHSVLIRGAASFQGCSFPAKDIFVTQRWPHFRGEGVHFHVEQKRFFAMQWHSQAQV